MAGSTSTGPRVSHPGTQLYHPAIYDRDRPAGSWWEASAGEEVADSGPVAGDHRVEVAVIGGGYAGLSTARHLAGAHGIEAVVLEAGRIGWGASGRNGGFVGLGGTKRGYGEIAAEHGRDAARELFAAQKAAIDFVLDTIRSHELDVPLSGPGELLVAHKPSRMAALGAKRDLIRSLFGEDWPVLDRAALRARGYASPEAHGALYVPHGTGLHPLRYVRGLARLALAAGVAVHGRSPVLAWERDGRRHRLRTPGGTIAAERVVLATNGYTPEPLAQQFAGATLPALSNILVTRPLTADERTAQGYTTDIPVADSRNLLFYIRLLPDGRLLFGGRGGTDASPSGKEAQARWMARRLGEVFPAWRGVAIEYRWNGLVCLTRDLVAHVGRLPDDPSIGFLLGWHGNGVSMAGYAGRLLAAELAGARPNTPPLPAFMRTPPPRFPWPAARVTALRAAYLWYRAQDNWF